MAKQIFKKQNVIDTAVNVGIGGASNVAIDYALDQIDMLKDIDTMYINGGKFVLGVVGSTMVSNRYVKAAMDGIATVGIANLAKSLMDGDDTTATTSGVPQGTVNAVPQHRAFGRRLRKSAKTSGAGQFVD